MSPTCRCTTAMLANFSRNGMLQQHKTCKKRPRHTQFIPIKADKFKSAQTYDYPSYHRVFDKTTNMSSNVATCCQMSCCLDTLADMQCRWVADMTKDVSATCRDTTQHVCKWRLGKTFQIKTFPAKANKVIGKDVLNIKTSKIWSGGAIAMFLGGCPVFMIMLIGRWSSDAFMRYIRKQIKEFSQDVSQKMITNIIHRYIPSVKI